MCFCLHLVVHEGKHVTSVGEIHHDDGTKFDRKSHEIRKRTTQGPRMTRRAQTGPRPGRPTHCSTASPRALTMVRYGPNTLYFLYVTFHFEPN
jgi:hypothetical protein